MSTIELLRLNTRVCITNPTWPHIRKTSIAHLTTRYTFTSIEQRVATAVAVKSDDPNIPTVVTLTATPGTLTASERTAMTAFLADDLTADPASIGPTVFSLAFSPTPSPAFPFTSSDTAPEVTIPAVTIPAVISSALGG